jgi:hypothetical protein
MVASDSGRSSAVQDGAADAECDEDHDGERQDVIDGTGLRTLEGVHARRRVR